MTNVTGTCVTIQKYYREIKEEINVTTLGAIVSTPMANRIFVYIPEEGYENNYNKRLEVVENARKTANLLSKQYVNEGLNTSSAVTNLNSILGAKVRKDIRAGDVIKQSDLCLIAKGDIVTIEAVSSNMQIKTQGVALEEGKLNDLISVRNSKSKKVIQGIVVSPNTVRVTF